MQPQSLSFAEKFALRFLRRRHGGWHLCLRATLDRCTMALSVHRSSASARWNTGLLQAKLAWLFSGSGVLSGRHDGRAAKALGW